MSVLVQNGGVTTLDDIDSATLTGGTAVPIGWAIKVIRTERGRSRRDLATATGISYSYLGHVETGRKIPSPDVLLKIAQALDISTGDLLSRARNRSPMGAVPNPTVSGKRDDIRSQDERDRGQTIGDYDLGLTVAELADLLRKMSPGDRDRVLDLARRLAK